MTNSDADQSNKAEVLEKEAAQIDARSEDAAAEIAELEGDVNQQNLPDQRQEKVGRTGPAVAFKDGKAPDHVDGVTKQP